MSLFNEEFHKRVEELFLNYPRKVHALLPLLHMVQNEKGFIDSDSMEEVAGLCGVSLSHVQGVVTFYTMYTQKPRGRCRVSVCTNIACYVRGGVEILEHVEKKLSVHRGHSTEDEAFYLEEVECLGACGYAPVMMVDEDYHENLTTDKVDEILEKVSKNSDD